jgi:hypothetical protein
MLEAANTSMPDQDIDYGENLGAIGSVIIAECLFKEYWRTFPVIEANDQVKEVSYLIFGQDFPNTMSKLITQILRRKNWTEVQPKFW